MECLLDDSLEVSDHFSGCQLEEQVCFGVALPRYVLHFMILEIGIVWFWSHSTESWRYTTPCVLFSSYDVHTCSFCASEYQVVASRMLTCGFSRFPAVR